jgi:hypothetical protein
MQRLTEDTIGGFNSMIEKQKKEEGEAYVTTVLFSGKHTLLHDHVNIHDVSPITDKEYFASGSTALLDAVGDTINTIGNRLNNTPEEDRPEKVIFVITTDGQENASREFSKNTIKEMIEHQQDKYSWLFMFLGANIDAVGEASNLGINTQYARNYTASSVGTDSLYASVSNAIAYARGTETHAEGWTTQAASEISKALDDVK